MKIEKQKVSLPVVNRDKVSLGSTFKKHGPLFGGSSKRGLIVGASGCGKTNVIISLLEHPNGLRFENVYIYSKSLYQSKYEYLKQLLMPLKDIGYYEFNDGADVVPPSEIKSNSVIIFDDVACCNQSIMRDYFCFGRHKNTDCFYLCQTYSSIPKQLIRDNANFIVLFKQDATNLKHIYDDHVNVDMSFQQLKDICGVCWEDPYGFLVIDKDFPLRSGRYRKGFDAFILP